MLNKSHSIFAVLLLLLILCLPIMAQESTEQAPLPAPSEAPATSPLSYSEFAQNAVILLLIYVVMEVSKRIPFLAKYDPFKLSMLVTGLLYLGYQAVWIYGGDVGAYWNYLSNIGETGNNALSLYLTFAGAVGTHHIVKNTKGMFTAPKATTRPLD